MDDTLMSHRIDHSTANKVSLMQSTLLQWKSGNRQKWTWSKDPTTIRMCYLLGPRNGTIHHFCLGMKKMIMTIMIALKLQMAVKLLFKFSIFPKKWIVENVMKVGLHWIRLSNCGDSIHKIVEIAKKWKRNENSYILHRFQLISQKVAVFSVERQKLQ